MPRDPFAPPDPPPDVIDVDFEPADGAPAAAAAGPAKCACHACHASVGRAGLWCLDCGTVCAPALAEFHRRMHAIRHQGTASAPGPQPPPGWPRPPHHARPAAAPAGYALATDGLGEFLGSLFVAFVRAARR